MRAPIFRPGYNPGMKRYIAIPCAILLGLGGVGCEQEKRNDPSPPTVVDSPTYYQKYDYSTVKEKAKNLRKGMTTMQTLILLGSPAKKEPNVWTYLPQRSGLFIPAESLLVMFEYGRVADWKTAPIILGEQIK